jgi:hypothetical protein
MLRTLYTIPLNVALHPTVIFRHAGSMITADNLAMQKIGRPKHWEPLCILVSDNAGGRMAVELEMVERLPNDYVDLLLSNGKLLRKKSWEHLELVYFSAPDF